MPTLPSRASGFVQSAGTAAVCAVDLPAARLAASKSLCTGMSRLTEKPISLAFTDRDQSDRRSSRR
jgi:hypothetical protein